MNKKNIYRPFKTSIFKIKVFKKVRYFILFILFTVLTLTLLYNSCTSQSIENIKFSKILNGFLQDFRVEIKNGSYSTKTLKDTPVNFKVPTKNLRGEAIDYEMKISQTPDCSGGEWESYQKETTWTFQSEEEGEEKLLFIYVKFREKREKEVNYIFETKEFEEAQGESKCIYDSIVYDIKPPKNLKLNYKPAKKTNQKKAEFRFTAKDYSPIHFQCRLTKPGGSNPLQTNSEETLWTSCTSGISYDSSNFEQEGKYTFSLKARDLSGNTSEILVYTWTIDSTAPSLSFPSCPKDLNASASEPSSISVISDNLNFPASLYCKNNQGQFESCGVIDSSQTPGAIDATHSIEEQLTTNYYKKTLNIKAIDPSGNFSEPIECVWHIDTGHPTIEFVTPTPGNPLIPERSYGTSTDPYIHPNPFKIRIDDNGFQTPQSHFRTKIEYKVYNKRDDNLSPSTCNDPVDDWCKLSTCNSQINGWCELSLNQPLIFSDLNFNTIYLETQPIHITQGLKPGINTANEHKIEIQVKDAVGNISNTIEATWDVYGQVEQSYSAQSISTTTKGKADILFVLDDSGSMNVEATQLGNSFSGIISSLSSLNWQIAVTSMERGRTNFGQLVQLIQPADNQGQPASFLVNQYILSSQTTCEAPLYCSSGTSEAEAIFKRTITKINGEVNNFTFSGGNEYGVQSVNALLDRYNQAKTLPPHATATPLQMTMNSFLRPNSTFVVVFITDEKNCGTGTSIKNCHNNDQTNINHHQNLINKVKTIFGDDKKFISYPIIPNGDDDDYLELAKTTQGRESKTDQTNPVIWVDVNPDQNSRTSSNSNTGCSTSSSSGVYTRDLCTISEDILKVTTRTIQLNCTPVTENLDTIGIHPPRYFYSSDPNADSNDPTLFTRLNTGTNTGTNKIVSIRNVNGDSVDVTIRESWNSSSSSNDTNRVTLEVQSGNDLPIGTYKVEYFCYSDQISTSN